MILLLSELLSFNWFKFALPSKTTSMFLSLLPDLPFKEPVIVFTLLISIILVAPILFKKFRIPGIVGLIVSGIIIGPHAFNLVEFGESIKLLSTAGLLYLMFLAGLELDTRELIRTRQKSLAFGTLTFLIPLIFGFIVAYFLLTFSFLASLLIASMFSTHTLISYQIASRLGIMRSEVVNITIGGTIITDTAVLVMLAFISAASKDTLTLFFWVKTLLSISAFSFLILWGVPKASSWFFKNLEGESGSQYVFVLAMLFISGLLARLAGIEPIIGSFLAGLALSNLIPRTSALMNRVAFIGNNLFIPIFLISVGLLVDISIFFEGTKALIFAVTMVIVAVASKFIAAWVVQKIFHYTRTERQVIFGMSVSHAAAIIAVVVVGYNLGLIKLEVLNGAILIILVSCLIGSFVTERAGRQLALEESAKLPVLAEKEERILVPVSNPATIETLIDFAILIRQEYTETPLYMLSVVPDNEFAQEQILRNKKMYESAISHAAASETDVKHISRVDLNVANGIAYSAKELMINKVVLGWNGRMTTADFFFGSIIEKLIMSTEKMVIVVKSTRPLFSTKRIVVLLPRNAEFEAGYSAYIETIGILAKRLSASIVFIALQKTVRQMEAQMTMSLHNIKTEFIAYHSSHPIAEIANLITENDLYIVVAARLTTLSYNHYIMHVPRDLARFNEKNNFVILYPEQSGLNELSQVLPLDMHQIAPNIESFGRFPEERNFVINKKSEGRHNSATE